MYCWSSLIKLFITEGNYLIFLPAFQCIFIIISYVISKNYFILFNPFQKAKTLTEICI